MWSFKRFLIGGLAERSGVRWSCSVWRCAPVPGIHLGRVGLGGPGALPFRLGAAMDLKWGADPKAACCQWGRLKCLNREFATALKLGELSSC